MSFWNQDTRDSLGGLESLEVIESVPITALCENDSVISASATVENNKNDAIDKYQNKANHLIELINDLNDIGTGTVLGVDLPCLVVAGNQSVGKSSLLEGICGIKLPRGDGTCTRCVLEIRLKSSPSAWNCNISLKTSLPPTFPSPSSLGKDTVSDQSTSKILFANTLDRENVGVLITKAQKALLNPSKEQSLFLDNESSSNAIDELVFTSNIILIEIFGANMDLSLIDLPGTPQPRLTYGILGIIKSTNHSPALVPMLENLCKFYISRPNTLILAVISCKDDIENQAIFQLARNVDPTGKRTIGVLTKPDTIEPTTHDRWIKVLNGTVYPLKLGYFIVKMPSKSEMRGDSTLEAMQKLEDGFFNCSDVWRSMRNKMPDRFGITALRKHLCSLLLDLIEASIPRLERVTEISIENVNKTLESLPPSPVGKDPKIELLQSIRHFSTLFQLHVNAQQNLKVFHQKIRRHYDNFKESIVATRLCLTTNNTSTTSTSIGSFWKRSASSGGSGGSGELLDSDSGFASSPGASAYSITIHELKSIVASQKGKELDGHYSPYGAFEHLVRKSQNDWKSIVLTLVTNVAAEISNLVEKLADQVFNRFPLLRTLVRTVTQGFQTEMQRNTADLLGHTLAIEARYPFTLNTAAFTNHKQEILDQLLSNHNSLENNSSSSSREKTRAGETRGTTDALKRAVAALHEAGLENLTPSLLVSRLSSSYTLSMSNQHLLDLLASALSYFDISAFRFIDSVCQQIDYHLLFFFSEYLEKELVLGLGVFDKREDQLRVLVCEEEGVRMRRERAVEERKMLEMIWKALYK